MRVITTFTFLALATALALVPGRAAAQSEDESIMRQDKTGGTDMPPPAPTEEEEIDEQVFYSGLGVGRADSGFSNLGEAINLDLVLGFRIPTVKWFGIEIDIGQTLIPGENVTTSGSGPPICDIDPNVLFPNGSPSGCTPSNSGGQTNTRDRDEFGMQALGLSAVLKSTGRFYVSGRYGYRYIATSIDELNKERSSNGFGAGVGYRWGKGLSGVELTYKELSSEVDEISLVFFARMGRN